MKAKPGKSEGGGFSRPLPYEARRKAQPPLSAPMYEVARMSPEVRYALEKYGVAYITVEYTV